MNYGYLLNSVVIRPWSTVLIGKNILCDGFDSTDIDEKRELAFFSHIHDDHSEGFERALGECDYVYVSKPTKELFIALKGDWLRKRKNFLDVDYGIPVRYKGEQITLFETDHILGSSQILVEDESGIRIVYSADFNMPYTKPMECDVLVLDSVHGDPRYNNTSNPESLVAELVKIIKSELKKGNPVIIRSYRGKLQKLMHILRKEIDSPIPFVAPTVDCRLADVYGHYNMGTDGLIQVESLEFQDIEGSHDMPYVRFHETGGPMISGEGTEIMRIRVGSSHESNSERSKSIDLTDHASFQGILDYVKQCEPKLVITDNSRRSRIGIADTLAKEIINKLNIKAISSPLEYPK